MKQSNYIIIVLFVFVIGCTLVLFISARGHENESYFANKEYFIDNEYLLDSINVIVAEQEASINIRSSDKNSLSIDYPKGEKEPDVLFRISNDTLFVPKVGSPNETYVNIHIKSLSSIVVKNKNSIRINSFSSDKLEIDAEQANINISDALIDEIVIQAIHSNISIYSTTETASVSAKLERESNLRINSAKNISKVNIEKDESSRCNLYQ